MTGILSGKKGLIMGVANDHSIAWGIAKALADLAARMDRRISVQNGVIAEEK